MSEFENWVAINECGLRIGECHQRAKFTDADVELMRQLAEGGMSYSEIAVKFETNKYVVGKICRYEVRNQTTAGWKVIRRVKIS